MRYVTYNEVGTLTGCYLQDLLEEHFDNAIEISEEMASSWVAYKMAEDRQSLELAPVAEPVVTVPSSVTMRQARLALLGAGLLATVNSTIAALTGAQGEAARIEWDYSSEVKRNQPLVLGLASELLLTEVDIDNLFITAASIA